MRSSKNPCTWNLKLLPNSYDSAGKAQWDVSIKMKSDALCHCESTTAAFWNAVLLTREMPCLKQSPWRGSAFLETKKPSQET